MWNLTRFADSLLYSGRTEVCAKNPEQSKKQNQTKTHLNAKIRPEEGSLQLPQLFIMFRGHGVKTASIALRTVYTWNCSTESFQKTDKDCGKTGGEHFFLIQTDSLQYNDGAWETRDICVEYTVGRLRICLLVLIILGFHRLEAL